MIAVAGECLVDLIPDGSGRYVAHPGGSPANTAVALARLGSPVLMLARLSTDEPGQLLRQHLIDNGVDLSRAVRTTDPSGLAVVSRDASGSASYRFALDSAADWLWTAQELRPLPDGVRALHAGSLALATAPGGAVLEDLLARERTRCTTSIDPNLRPGLLGPPGTARERMRRWLGLADLVKASAEDVALLHPGAGLAEVARDWAAEGPGLVVLTDGAAGVLAVHGEDELRLPAVAVSVVDTVGAGDTFTAGLLHALGEAGALGDRLTGLPRAVVEQALGYAARAAAITCSRAGADPPRAAELAD